MTEVELYTDIREIRSKLDSVCEDVSKLRGEARTVMILTRWVVFPLIIVLGGLSGVNLLM